MTVQTYTLYVHDRRYSVPTLLAADFAHDERALQYARDHLKSSDHYFAVEVWLDDDKLAHIEPDPIL